MRLGNLLRSPRITKRGLWALAISLFATTCVLLFVLFVRVGYGYLHGDFSSEKYCQMLASYQKFMIGANTGLRRSGAPPPYTPFYDAIMQSVVISALCNACLLGGLAVVFVFLVLDRIVGARVFLRSIPLGWTVVCVVSTFVSLVFLYLPIHNMLVVFASEFSRTWGDCNRPW